MEGKAEKMTPEQKRENTLKLRMVFLCKEYEPNQDCKESNFSCDFRVDDSDQCPCQFVKEFMQLYGIEKSGPKN